MSCGCNQTPCSCNTSLDPNKFCGCNRTPCTCYPSGVCSCNEVPCICACPPPPRPRTFCDRDRKNNVWVEGVQDEDGNGGICMLDTMTRAQVISILECDEVARADLKRVTSDPCLLEMAEKVKRLPTEEESDREQRELGRAEDSIPFYTIFRGQPPFAQ